MARQVKERAESKGDSAGGSPRSLAKEACAHFVRAASTIGVKIPEPHTASDLIDMSQHLLEWDRSLQSASYDFEARGLRRDEDESVESGTPSEPVASV